MKIDRSELKKQIAVWEEKITDLRSRGTGDPVRALRQIEVLQALIGEAKLATGNGGHVPWKRWRDLKDRRASYEYALEENKCPFCS